MVARMGETTIREEVREQEGMAVYLFIDDHVKRVINTMRARWVHRSPYYVVNKNGKLTRIGNFNTARPYLYRLYHDFLLRSETLRFFRADFPLTIGTKHIATSARVIEEAYKTYKRIFGNDKFYVVINYYGTDEFVDELVRSLSYLGLSVVN